MVAPPTRRAACSDVNTVQGVYPITPRYDNIPGHEGVGEVVATGAAVSALTPGDRVVPLAAGLGTWRTGGVWEAADWFRVDPALPLADAATLTINPGTALSMLEQFVALEAGDAVVQNGANSAVGEYVIQLAHHKGVKTVNMVRDRGDWAGLHAHLTRLGADLVATPESVREQARTAGLPAPRIALNCVGGESATTQAKMLAAGGVHVTYGGLSRQPVTVPTPVLLFRDVAVRGFWISGNSEAARDAGKKREMLQRLQKLILDGVIAARCTELPFSRWREAFQAGTNRGRKMLLVMGGDES